MKWLKFWKVFVKMGSPRKDWENFYMNLRLESRLQNKIMVLSCSNNASLHESSIRVNQLLISIKVHSWSELYWTRNLKSLFRKNLSTISTLLLSSKLLRNKLRKIKSVKRNWIKFSCSIKWNQVKTITTEGKTISHSRCQCPSKTQFIRSYLRRKLSPKSLKTILTKIED